MYVYSTVYIASWLQELSKDRGKKTPPLTRKQKVILHVDSDPVTPPPHPAPRLSGGFLRETAKHTTVVLQQAFEACKPGASQYFTHQQGVDTLVVNPKLRVIRLNGIYICMYIVQCILQAGCK